MDIDIDIKSIQADLVRNNYLTQTQVDFLNSCVVGGYWVYKKDRKEVDVIGSFLAGGRGIKDLLGIKFGFVQGTFEACYNFLINLDGFPRIIHGDLDIRNNPLTSLEGMPASVICNIHLPKDMQHIEPMLRTVMSHMNCHSYPYEIAVAFTWEQLSKKEQDFFINDLPLDHKELRDAHNYGIF